MIGLREKEKAQAPRGPFRGVVRLHVRRLPPLALPAYSRARVPLAGREPGTGPPPEAWLSSPGGLSLGSPSAPSGCERGCHRARRGGPVPSSRLPGCPAQGRPLQEDAPPHGAQPALVPGVREFGTIRWCRSGGAPRVHSALRAPEPGGCLGQAPVVPVREAAWPGVGGVPLCCSAARRLSTYPGEPRCPQLLREGEAPLPGHCPGSCDCCIK